MSVRLVVSATSVAALVLLAACGGSSDGSPTTTGPTGSTGSIGDLAGGFDGSGGISTGGFPPGTGSVFLSRIQEISDITTAFSSSFSGTTVPTLPPGGTGNFSGAGVIVDVNIPDDVDTLAEIAPYAVVATTATASVDFASGAFTAQQGNFVDVTDAPVAGVVDYSGTIVGGASATASVTGSIAGTNISTTGGFAYFDASPAIVIGSFVATGSGGTYNGIELGGGFFADQD